MTPEDIASWDANRKDRTTRAISRSENSRGALPPSAAAFAFASKTSLTHESIMQWTSPPAATYSFDLAQAASRNLMAALRDWIAPHTLVPGIASGKLTSSSALVIFQYSSEILKISSLGMCLPQKTRSEVCIFICRTVCMIVLGCGSLAASASHSAKCLRAIRSCISR